MSREWTGRDAPFRPHPWGVGKRKTCVGFEQAAALPMREDCNRRRQAMALLGLGYAGFGSDNLEDWRQFGTGLVGLQAVERGNSLLAFRMDDRKQRIVIDRAIGERHALLRLGGRRRRGAGCAGGAAGKGRRGRHRRAADAGRRQARPQPDFVSRSRPATGWRRFTAPRSTTRRSCRADRSRVSAPARSGSAMPC